MQIPVKKKCVKIKIFTPTSSTNILSSPTGPNDDLTTFAIATAAVTKKNILLKQYCFLKNYHFEIELIDR